VVVPSDAFTPAQSSAEGAAWVDALELLVGVLSRSEASDLDGDGFYSRLCEAVCQLVRMRRAVIFRYDSASRRVRAAGAFGIDLRQFAHAHVTVESAPITAQALREDRLVEVRGDLREHVPSDYAGLVAEPAQLVCVPMASAGRAIGVILADRKLEDPPLEESERQLLWTLGKTAALASVARIYVTQREIAKQLEHRIDLAREVHEHVIQRLFGVSMALDGEGDLPAELRQRCAGETQAALGDLRSAMQRQLGRAPRPTVTKLVDELERLRNEHPALGLRLIAGDDIDVPPRLEPVAQSVLTEAVRNAQKHAKPTSVEVRLRRTDGAFTLEIVNDGVIDNPSRRPGLGLRLAAFEALQSGGVVEFGEREPGRWQVRLVVPLDGEDA
jgi:signal transduction histidine kinase